MVALLSPRIRERLHNGEVVDADCTCQLTECEECPECRQYDPVAIIHPVAEAVVVAAAVEKYNVEYGPFFDPEQAYTVEGFDLDQLPLSIDLVQFVMWLRKDTDFFSGPDLNLHYPKWDSKEFAEVLAELVLEYTGE